MSPEVDSVKQTGQKKTRRHDTDHDDSLMDVVVDEDYDFIPGTPPHKKVSCVKPVFITCLAGYRFPVKSLIPPTPLLQ